MLLIWYSLSGKGCSQGRWCCIRRRSRLSTRLSIVVSWSATATRLRNGICCVQFTVGIRVAAGGMPTWVLMTGQVAYITTRFFVPDKTDAAEKIEDWCSLNNGETCWWASSRLWGRPEYPSCWVGNLIWRAARECEELLVDVHELVSAAKIGLLTTAKEGVYYVSCTTKLTEYCYGAGGNRRSGGTSKAFGWHSLSQTGRDLFRGYGTWQDLRP